MLGDDRQDRVDAAAPLEDTRALIERIKRTFTITITVANLVGGLIVFGFLAVVLPERGGPEVGDVLALNIPAGIAFVAVTSWLGARAGGKLADRTLAWLHEERDPSPEELRRTLRGPGSQLIVPAGIWTAAAVYFSLINLPLSTELAGRAATATIMGGLAACAASYLLGERVVRPITARALATGVPLRPVLPGVTTRTVLTWALTTGVPVVGIAMVAFGVLQGDTPQSNATMWSIIFLCVVALAVGLAAIVIVARSVAEPIQSVRQGLARVERGDLDVEIPVWDASEVGLLQAGFNQMGAGLRERERLQDLFGRHVGEDVARRALDAGVELGGETREAAVLFVDVIGSTRLAAHTPPDEVVKRLNVFFGLVLDVVSSHHGWVNKFVGDAALCVFGVPEEASDDPAGDALAAARELGERLESESPLGAAIGVSAGPVVAGNIGAAERFEYTVIGDPVNEAARLTELAKERQPPVLASGAALGRASADEAAHWQHDGEVTLRGRSDPTRLAFPVGAGG